MKPLFFDVHGFLVDQTGDGGDSAMRAGISSAFGVEFLSKPWAYVNDQGICVRHPVQKPWDNPNNFSRDQLICLVFGLKREGRLTSLNAIFWSHAKRLFFCQNIDRDRRFSRKHPYPHSYEENGKIVRKLFDYRDPLLPHDVWYLIKCAEIKWLYPFAVIGIPSFIIALFIHTRSKWNEDNQIICQCFANGSWAVKLFKWLKPNWKNSVAHYWLSRNEPYFSEIIIRKTENI